MFSNRPSESSTQASRRTGMRLSSSGSIPSFDMCQVSIARPPFGASAPSTSASAVSREFTLTSNGMNS